HITVKGNHVVVKIDDKVVVDYTEPDDIEGTVRLSEGTIALQAHDPGSTVYFRNIRIKPLD
ncbi:MAG: family 16 glycoside hydrolase, partial [Planctomycetota bacterium]|nr:family 16 glycoside hydrolase [Planctomycetota bacterium]